VIYRQGKLCLGSSVKDIRLTDATKYFWEISNLNVYFLNSVFSNLIKVNIGRIFNSKTFKKNFQMSALAYITLIFTLCANISQQKIQKSPFAKQRTLQHPSRIECAKGKHLETINEGIAGEESYCAHNIFNCVAHLKPNGECSQCQSLYKLTEDTEKTPRTFCSQRLEYWIPMIVFGTGGLIL
jgi:hypothetical protein